MSYGLSVVRVISMATDISVTMVEVLPVGQTDLTYSMATVCLSTMSSTPYVWDLHFQSRIASFLFNW